MKKSLQNKLFIRVILLVILLELISWMIFTIGLERYYHQQNTHLLMGIAHRIERSIYEGGATDINRLLLTERSTGTSILILDKDLEIKYGVRMRPRENYSLDQRIEALKDNKSELYKQGVFAGTTRDSMMDGSFFNLYYLMKNQEILILSAPLNVMQDSINIVTNFFVWTGLITLLLSGAITYIFARRFTEPIKQLNNIANSMAHLDFSNKYQGNNDDEIGELGASINSLSEQLGNSISELQAANAILQADIERERRIDEMRKEFISNVSHELKTPVALIQGYAEGLKINVIESLKDKEFYCEVIIDESIKMNKLINELLNLSQIEAGYFKSEKVNFDLMNLIKQVVAKYKPILENNEIVPEVIGAENILVYADMLRTEQILINYINNALNHIDEKKILLIKCEQHENMVKISVYNSGKNIPEEFLDKIFISFYKVDKARTRDYGGTGLGLSIVKAIQDLEQKGYGVINEPEGVLFWFDLQVANFKE